MQTQLGVTLSPNIKHYKPIREQESQKKTKKLGQLLATSICGNDISSSCLYVAGISIAYAGALAPISLIIVAFVLYLYKKVYAEVGSALPLNGGAYNCLLNTTSKFKASIAACMSILSYIATAVISAMTAIAYFSTLVNGIDIITGTILLMLAFATLTIIGIGESAVVATVIFILHIITLLLFSIIGIFYMPFHLDILVSNWSLPNPDQLLIGLFLGFSAALLGISGFESSANFIEEQKPGVFVKTLRNMWVTVSIFNPLIAIIALGVMPISEIAENTEYLLSSVAQSMGFDWLKILISIDAFLVLSGAVLTSFVGVVGLVRRMTLDRCLPQFLLKSGKRNTNYIIILTFFILCSSILLITNGDLLTLAGVYTISFLGVMTLFAVGNMLLKVKRKKLKRNHVASWPTVIFAFLFTFAGILGNALFINPDYVNYFLIYFLPTIAIVGLMFIRLRILKYTLSLIHYIFDYMNQLNHDISKYLIHKINRIRDLKVIYFTRGDSRADLIKVMLYVKKNEITKRIKFIHIYNDESEIPPTLKDDIKWLDDAFPDVRVDLELIKGDFGPEIIDHISRTRYVPKNYMFIGTPGDHVHFSIEDFGEVRLII